MGFFLKSNQPQSLARGKRSEVIAVQFLKSQGYRIIATNVRFRCGELDIVAGDGETLVFVEVRSTASADFGGPFATITGHKQRKLIRAASAYLSSLKTAPVFTRFDAVGITWTDPNHPQIDLIRDAFGTNY